jgi:hypothetical protein
MEASLRLLCRAPREGIATHVSRASRVRIIRWKFASFHRSERRTTCVLKGVPPCQQVPGPVGVAERIIEISAATGMALSFDLQTRHFRDDPWQCEPCVKHLLVLGSPRQQRHSRAYCSCQGTCKANCASAASVAIYWDYYWVGQLAFAILPHSRPTSELVYSGKIQNYIGG